MSNNESFCRLKTVIIIKTVQTHEDVLYAETTFCPRRVQSLVRVCRIAVCIVYFHLLVKSSALTKKAERNYFVSWFMLHGLNVEFCYRRHFYDHNCFRDSLMMCDQLHVWCHWYYDCCFIRDTSAAYLLCVHNCLQKVFRHSKVFECTDLFGICKQILCLFWCFI